MQPSSAPIIRVSAMPTDANYYGDIFGGWLMGQMDLAAGSIAAGYSKGRAVTVAIDAVSFLKPVCVGDEVSIYGEVKQVGKTSMKIAVEAWRRELTEANAEKVTDALFTFVAIDGDRAPRKIESS